MLELGLARAAREAAGEIALVCGGASFTFGELAVRAARVRASLVAEGVGAGDRVALIAANTVETVVTIHALIDLGAAVVPVHPRLTRDEVEVILESAAPRLTLRDGEVIASTARSIDAPAPIDPARPLALVYTSGTTGRPKGAVLSRRAFIASARGSGENLGWRADDRWLAAMPLCHVGGLSILTRCLLARRPVVLLSRFDPDAVLDAIGSAGATLLSVVPTMLAALLERDRDNVLARLRAMLVGGAAAPPALIEECARRGVPALTTYGLTEACSQVTVQPIAAAGKGALGSGVPLAGVEVRIARADGSSAAAGEAGRILVRGATMMDGYFAGPRRTLDRAVDAEGFFDTGDFGERDADGALFVHARRSDLVVTGGENVYPVEVEQRLEATPGVRRAVVFGVPDARWGQIVAAAIELAAGGSLEAVAEACAASLAPHKRPRLACVVETIPLTGSGKVDRRALVDRYGAALRPLDPGRAR